MVKVGWFWYTQQSHLFVIECFNRCCRQLLNYLRSDVSIIFENANVFLNPQYTKPSSSTLFTKLGSSEDPMVFFFCNFSAVWCGRLLKLCFFLGFWNYNSVIQALLASNILCLFISTEVTYTLTHHSSSIWTMSSSEHCRPAIFQIYNVHNLKITRRIKFRICNVVYQAGSRWDPRGVFNFLLFFLKEHFISLIT